MNWRLVLPLAGFGVLMGAASVLGLTTGVEGWLWLGIGLICAAVLALRVQARLWWHGFLVGFVGGGVAPLIQFLFFSTYVANNPEFQQDLAQVPGGLEPRFFVLLLVPVAGVLTGAVLGTGTWVAGMFLTRRSVAAQHGDAADRLSAGR